MINESKNVYQMRRDNNCFIGKVLHKMMKLIFFSLVSQLYCELEMGKI